MYYYLNGKVANLMPDRAVIDCAGVGYLLLITRKTYDALVSQGHICADGQTVQANAKLYTYYHVREDAAELYGFYSENECSIFKMLISVSGVGPKVALSILSTLSVQELVSAIAMQDAKAISASPGIGLKSAQKIILELKDKLSADFDTSEVLEPVSRAEEVPGDIAREAINALAVLGYSRQEATKAVKASKGDTLEQVIKHALSNLI